MRAIPFVFVAALCCGTVVPQDPKPTTPVVPSLEQLAARVDAAHHPDGPVPPVTAFRSHIEMHLIDTDRDQGGHVDLSVRFLQWTRPGSDVVRSLIRYEVLEAGSPIERGRDRNGPWQRFQGKAQDLRKAEFADDLAAYERHTNLARQLLRFLDPGAVLRSLERPGAVRAATWQRGRAKIPCHAVAGELSAFPLLQQGGEDRPVRLEVFVDAADGRLLGVEAMPLQDGVPMAERLEQVRLLDLEARDGLLVPRGIVHLFRKADGELHPYSRAVLTSLSLRPELRAEDFDRPSD